MTDEAVFLRDGRLFVPTRSAVSPWGDNLLHGGPPAALLAWAIEGVLAGPEFQVSRLTVDLLRPVPRAPLEAVAESIRSGNRLQVIEARLLASGELVAKASALALRQSGVVGSPDSRSIRALPGPETATEPWQAGPRPGATADDSPPRAGFHIAVDARRLLDPQGGSVAMWVRIPLPLILGEPTSPLMRAAATSDFVNAFSSFRRRSPPEEGGARPQRPATAGSGSINADSTLYLHRMPEGEWLALEAERIFEPHGVGVSWATMHDQRGPVGRVMQATLANSRR